MGFFDFFKGNSATAGPFASGSYVDSAINDEELVILIHQAIAVFRGNPGYNAGQLIDGIKIFRNEEALAVALYRFIPLAFCRVIFPEPAYSDEFVLTKKGKTVATHSFSADRIFTRVLEECRKSFAMNSDQQKALNILLHSAEFNALNKALENGSNLQDLQFSPTVYPEPS